MGKNVHFIFPVCEKPSRYRGDAQGSVATQAGISSKICRSRGNRRVTCGFIGPAKEESIDTILEMGRYKEDRCERLVVAGCLSQRYATHADEMPEVDHFLGSSDMLGSAGPQWKPGPHARWQPCGICDGVHRSSNANAIRSPGFHQNRRGVQSHAASAQPVYPRQATLAQRRGHRRRGFLRCANVASSINLVSQDTIGYRRDLDGRPKLPISLTRSRTPPRKLGKPITSTPNR